MPIPTASAPSLDPTTAKPKEGKPLVSPPTAVEAAIISTTTAAAPKRSRRRRVPFAVMVVVDAAKQNARWDNRPLPSGALGLPPTLLPSTLLQPDDVILSIGTTNIAGITFAEACKVFAAESFQVGDTEIWATLVVARKKPPPPALPEPAPFSMTPTLPATAAKTTATALPDLIHSHSDSGSKTNPSIETVAKGSLPLPPTLVGRSSNKTLSNLPLPEQNPSMSFSLPETAVLADAVLQAIHHPRRLLGNQLSRGILQETTRLFRRAARLTGGPLGHRSVETLAGKWGFLESRTKADLSQRAALQWQQALRLETGGEASEIPFSSDAERAALRQLPRPSKGCRCGGKDHEYLHDVRCSLYRDLCRLIPSEEQKDLLHDPEDRKTQRAKKALANHENFKDLSTVETGIKDRLVKLKTATELEEAEARFVARMEEVQSKQLQKAIFAPNLTTMVLSAIHELQREFPLSQAPEAMEVDDSDASDSDDQEEGEEKVTGVREGDSAGKRKRAPKEARAGKKTKTNRQVQHLNFRYLMRMVQYIGKTWGHVYREPSHKDYAWYVEIM